MQTLIFHKHCNYLVLAAHSKFNEEAIIQELQDSAHGINVIVFNTFVHGIKL